MVAAIESRVIEVIRGEGVDGGHESLLARLVGREGERRLGGLATRRRQVRRRRCRCKVSSRAPQLDKGVIEHDGFRVAKQFGVEPVENGVILQPHACKPVDAGLEGTIGIPKGLDLAKAIEWVIYANAADQLIEIQEGKGRRRFLDSSAAHLGTPGKVAAQLSIAHGIVGGKVRLKGAVVGTIVLEVGHQQALAVKELRLR